MKGDAYQPKRCPPNPGPPVGGGTLARIPRAIRRCGFCEKHQCSYDPIQGCPDCAAGRPAAVTSAAELADAALSSLFGVADEQPQPKGKGVDVASLVHADIQNLHMLLGERSPLEPLLMRIYLHLLQAAMDLRLEMFGGTGADAPARLRLDIEARIESGRKKYGERLTSHNGRDAKLDLYQELLDAVVYARQGIFESTER